MSLPWVTLRRKGTTSAARSGPPNETSNSASYGAGSRGDGESLGSAGVGWLRGTRHILGIARGTPGRRALPRIAAMLDPYRRVLSRPGAALFSATGLVARMPISMMTLAVVLLVTAETRSYTLAGQVSATFVIANALAAIPQGRLLDRLGQSRVLFVDSLVFALGSGMLGYAVVHHWSELWPHLAAAVAGLAMPPIGSSVRARWTHLLPDPHE